MKHWIPWTSEDYSKTECKRQAAELRASGKYQRVVIRSKAPDRRWNPITEEMDTIPFGRVYVLDK